MIKIRKASNKNVWKKNYNIGRTPGKGRHESESDSEKKVLKTPKNWWRLKRYVSDRSVSVRACVCVPVSHSTENVFCFVSVSIYVSVCSVSHTKQTWQTRSSYCALREYYLFPPFTSVSAKFSHFHTNFLARTHMHNAYTQASVQWIIHHITCSCTKYIHSNT